MDCERGFSALTRVKTTLRNRLSAKTLNHLLVITIEGPSPADYLYDKACDIWEESHTIYDTCICI